MTKAELGLLVRYHYWARDRVLEAVERLSPGEFTRDLQSSFRSIRDTLVHLCQSEWIWHARWQGESPRERPYPPESVPDVAAVRRLWEEQEGRIRAFVDGLSDADLALVVEYRLMSGEPGRSPIWQMVQHLVNHGSYHRGQVTTMLRQLGAAPAKSMDLIAFYREREA
jgi:uncharacterized damage-inducible protein DinB